MKGLPKFFKVIILSGVIAILIISQEQLTHWRKANVEDIDDIKPYLVSSVEFPITCEVVCDNNFSYEIIFDISEKKYGLYVPFKPITYEESNITNCNMDCGEVYYPFR